jgi:hypothetical protein
MTIKQIRVKNHRPRKRMLRRRATLYIHPKPLLPSTGNNAWNSIHYVDRYVVSWVNCSRAANWTPAIPRRKRARLAATDHVDVGGAARRSFGEINADEALLRL